MKKKFIFVLTIIVLVCTMSVALVACNPKNPEAFQVVNNGSALNELWEAWAKENFSRSNDTIGLNVNLNYKDSSEDISIALKGGLTQKEINKNVLSLIVKDNNKQESNKDILNLTLNSNGLFLYLDEFENKTFKMSDIKFPNLNGGIFEMLTIGNISDSLKTILVSLMAYTLDMEGSKVTIDPVLNGKNLYDTKYIISFKINSLIDSVVDSYLQSFMTEEMQLAIESIKDKLGEAKVDITANTTGNTRKKVAKPAKDAPKYEYVGGTLVDFDIEVGNAENKLTMNTKASDIKILNSIPEVQEPADFIDFDSYVFPSNINGIFNLKDINGNVLSKFECTANFDFNIKNVASTILACISNKNMAPLFDEMISDENGKIFVEITHTCDDSCKLDHLSKESKPILTVAYSPAEFKNNRIYVALNLRGIVLSSFGEQMLDFLPADSELTAQDMEKLLPEDDLTFSIDLEAYTNYTLIKNTFENNIQAVAGLFNMVSATTYEKNTSININNILNSIMNFEELVELKYYLENFIDIIFKDVDSIDIAYTHTNEHYTNGSVKEQFLKDRTFVYHDNFVYAPIIDKLTFVEKSEGVVEINKEDLYNEDGSLKALTENQVLELKGCTITADFTDALGNAVTEELVICDILGFDNTQLNQTIYLVVTGYTGNNYKRFIEDLQYIFGDISTEEYKDIVIADGVVELSISLKVE